MFINLKKKEKDNEVREVILSTMPWTRVACAFLLAYPKTSAHLARRRANVRRQCLAEDDAGLEPKEHYSSPIFQ